MALTHRQKRRWSLLILVIGLPVYIVLATTILALVGRPSIWVELLVYFLLGIAWALPFKAVFRGVGQAPPEGDATDRDDGSV